MTGGAMARVSAVVFVAAMLQAVIVSSLVIGGGAPDLLLVVAISLGLLRGSIAGAVSGFAGGLVVDLLTLDTLGITSLVLTLAGFWAGRYAETTGRGRRLAPLVAVGVITMLAGVFGFVLHYMLGVEVLARHALVTALAPTVLLNLLLALPVYALVRASVREPERFDRSPEVEVLV
ncbi:MAG: rod shape-determining protein MreD [Actinobacteria bacterium]|nr:rod shape-determining protein MreD [Actinomycetota bacterium]MBA3565955.1 rod shape-determining protein MreD [Actinomycetota bacterium]MDQ3426167.1 rod shape-determining protein MreD [Actinomycetota bacterium]